MKYRFDTFERAATCFALLCDALCPSRATAAARRSLRVQSNPETTVLAWHKEIKHPSFELRATRDSIRLVFRETDLVITLNATRFRLSLDTAPPWLRPPTVDAICAAVQKGTEPDLSGIATDRLQPVDS